MKRTILSIDKNREQDAKDLLTANKITWSQGRFHFDLATFVVTAIVTAFLTVVVF
jgi:hypothetical protein